MDKIEPIDVQENKELVGVWRLDCNGLPYIPGARYLHRTWPQKKGNIIHESQVEFLFFLCTCIHVYTAKDEWKEAASEN